MRALGMGVVTLAAIVAGAIVPTAAWADTGATGADFGAHVVMCAQTMGFDAQHNPGTHHGFADWDPSQMG